MLLEIQSDLDFAILQARGFQLGMRTKTFKLVKFYYAL